jgi:hypothetical protein
MRAAAGRSTRSLEGLPHGMRSRHLAAVIALATSPVFGGPSNEHTYVPPHGYVPNAETAIAIAVAVWTPIYGRDKIEHERPYRATLRGDNWIVEGSLPSGEQLGGTAVAEISKTDGRIVRVSHGK